MAWRVEVSRTAEQQISKLDRKTQVALIRYLRERVLALDDPRGLGKVLRGDQKGLWRYRVGDYRIICDIRDRTHTLVVLAVSHRKEIYR